MDIPKACLGKRIKAVFEGSVRPCTHVVEGTYLGIDVNTQSYRFDNAVYMIFSEEKVLNFGSNDQARFIDQRTIHRSVEGLISVVEAPEPAPPVSR
ncbi:hypothetical protein FJZ22_00925 [Candidatus Pacearchaeota archaeon]|nr:hypothetical protein [Candidatus Pacearchaeota archaeon]